MNTINKPVVVTATEKTNLCHCGGVGGVFFFYKLLWRDTKVLHSALMFTGVLNLDWY